MTILSFSVCLFAFNCFALSKFNHFKDVFNKRPTQQQSKKLLFIAWISILLSLALSILEFKGYGALQFTGFTALSALIIMVFYNFMVRYVVFFTLLNLAIIMLSMYFFALSTL